MALRVRPPRLAAGARLGLVAPSSPTLEPSTTARGVRTLESLGFVTELAPHAGCTYGYLAGRDQDRADDLLTMLERPDIDGVVCVQGGCGALRTAMALDPQRLARLRDRPPKVFVGYSDITVLHALIGRALGWVTFYGPMVLSMAHPSPYLLAGWRRALMSAEPFTVDPDPDDPYVETLVPGQAEGELAGGCLTLLAALIGTPWEPELGGRILFFEDVDEEPYRIERYLSQLIAAGRLDGVAGIVVGEHTDCGPKRPGPTLGLEQVFRDCLAPLGVPTLYHLPVGHGRHLATLPLGARVRLDADAGTLAILQGGVA